MAQNPSSGFPQASWLAQQNRLGQVPPSNTGEGGYSPYDPMQNIAQQAVQNPNAGDKYQQAAVADGTTNPDGTKKEKPGWGPKIPGVSTMAGDADAGEIGAATVLGMGTGGLAYYLTKKNSKTGVERHIEYAEKLDGLPIIKNISSGLNSIKAPGFLANKDWYKYWSLNYMPELDCKGNQANADKLEAHIIKHQQGVHVERSLKNFNKALQPKRSVWALGINKSYDLTGTYQGLHKVLIEDNQKVLDLHRQLVHEKLGKPTAFKSAKEAHEFYDGLNDTQIEALRKGEPLSTEKVPGLKSGQTITPGGFKYPINSKEDFARATYFDKTHLQDLTKTDEIQKHIANGTALEKVVQTQEIKRAYLQQKVNDKSASPEEKALLKRLSGTHDFLDKGVLQSSGVAGGNIRDKAKMTAEMRRRGVGSIGKFHVTTMEHMKNIFGGEMMMGSMGKNKMAAIPMLIFGSLVSSAMVIAPAIHAGNQADKGDKTKSFLENFVGFGICNFIGWELGRRFLAGTGLMHKILGRHSLKHPLKFMKPIPGFLGKWAGRTTLGGFATELVAMFAAGAIAESMGKKVVDLFFPGNGNNKDKNKNTQAANAISISGQDTASFGSPAGGVAGKPYFGASSNTGAAQTSPSGNTDTGNSGPQDSQYQDILNSTTLKNADSMIKNPYGNSNQQPYGLSGA